MFNRAPGIGLDIGSKKIKLAQVKTKNQSIDIIQYGSMLTPPGMVDGGVIYDPERLGEAMIPLVKKLGLQGKKVVSAVSGQQVYTRNLIMPSMPLNELREAVQFQAMSFLPIPVEETVIDIFPLRDFEDEEGKKTEVFFVAVRRLQVEALDMACKIAGLNLVAVEIEPIAIHRVLRSLSDEQNKAYLNIGASRSYFTVFRNEMMVFFRSLSFGSAAFFQQYDAITSDDKHGLEEINLVEDQGYDYLLRDIIMEMARSIEYYDMQNQGEEIREILICGGGSQIQQIGESLTSGINRELRVADVLSNSKFPPNINQVDYRELKHDFAVAIGLGARPTI